jgi:hypothetical protein
MANVIQIPNLSDDDAFYVWASETGPQWGTRKSFAAASIVRMPFPDSEWEHATEAASKEADQTGVATIYVVRNA